ncbi:MAG: tRNA (N(6)-L-threonylcarbamoyladenosine(37)-C(2))-methylthiotransferase MtaB [Dehalococcoidales bacterium]|nr:tRNA (N(6)-L-threonylcarbamoyladenosine(37)-C(2))-methylthiotransferase MtaB [Dehalococcoidales bacterium]
MRVAFETLGCKLNQAETESLARQFITAGHEIVNSVDKADIYILNTCTVTHTADAKSRHLLRSAHRRNPSAVLIATGCYAQRDARELTEIEGVNLVAGNDEKARLLQIVEKSGYPNSGGKSGSLSLKPSLRTRSFLKIQDGCLNFCAYCIVPFVRRNEMSVPPDIVVNEAKQRAREGYQEIVLTGTRVGSYSYGGVNLKGLLERIVNETEIPRLRLSSLQPGEISSGLIDLWKDSRLCPHFHLSLQSGSAGVLTRMRRRYTLDDFEQTVDIIREKVPAVAVTTDVIVGFPGETDRESKESMGFCRRMNFARIHVFPYSPRSGTEAAEMTGQIADSVKKERSSIMLRLAAESARKFREQFAGESLDVLWEKQTGEGVWSGITGNYIRVFSKDKRDLSNKLVSVKIK